jgi:general secretion pathway protein G
MKKQKTLILLILCGALIVVSVAAIKLIDYYNCMDCGGPLLSIEKGRILMLSSAVEEYKRKTGAYPTNTQGLSVLQGQGILPGKSNALQDGYGNPYYYESPGSHGHDYEITSYGADGKEGGEDRNADLHSWEVENELTGK